MDFQRGATDRKRQGSSSELGWAHLTSVLSDSKTHFNLNVLTAIYLLLRKVTKPNIIPSEESPMRIFETHSVRLCPHTKTHYSNPSTRHKYTSLAGNYPNIKRICRHLHIDQEKSILDPHAPQHISKIPDLTPRDQKYMLFVPQCALDSREKVRNHA